MKMNIGANLRRLRQDMGVTQEAVAARIGVLPQTVSKWEREDGLPDITQLVPLASYFGVTVDELLGRDREEEERKILSILSEYDHMRHIGDLSGCEDLMIDAYAAYPNDFRIVAKYVDALLACDSCLAYRDQAEEAAAYLLDNCTDETLRIETLVNLADGRFLWGDRDGAEKIANSLPPLWACREVVRVNGTETPIAERELIDRIMEHLFYAMYYVANTSEDTEADMLEDILALADIIYPDFDCGICHSGLQRVSAALFHVYAKAGNTEGAIRALERALHHSLADDTSADKVIEHTSPFVRGAKLDLRKTQSGERSNSVFFCLNDLLREEDFELDPSYMWVIEKYRPFAVEDITKS